MILNHVQLLVRDVAASRAFYAEWFGLGEAVHEEPDFVILRDAAGGLLALHAGRPAAAVEDAFHHSFHLGFQVPTAEDVEAFHERARAAGLEELAFERAGGFSFARVRDPDGHAVEVYVAGP
jgi:catechol 2,3-dioxygenase-like lactoylglutathione lyase family enzyme